MIMLIDVTGTQDTIVTLFEIYGGLEQLIV